MAEFDPSGVAVKNGNFFGFPYTPDEASIVVLSAPWDVTTSYREGTAHGPHAVLEASYQLDYTSPYKEEAWKTKIATLPLRAKWLRKSTELRRKAKAVIEAQERGVEPAADILSEVNAEGARFHAELEGAATEWLERGKRVVTLGGDHSVSFGPIRALARRGKFSVLHIDAHADLRVAYEGFEHSHASIMHHVTAMPEVEHLVQVGLRDVSPMEVGVIRSSKKITAFFDGLIRRETARGASWVSQCKRMIEPLGRDVYLSFDVDGLDPKYCPSTGTPVPGGLEIWEVFTLLEELRASGRRLIGFDLVEVAPGATEWDANVGARLLYQICQFVE